MPSPPGSTATSCGKRATARAPRICSQQTMLHIHRARDRFIAGAEVRPWAFAIARRLLVDEVRRGRRVVLSDDGDPDLGVSDQPHGGRSRAGR